MAKTKSPPPVAATPERPIYAEAPADLPDVPQFADTSVATATDPEADEIHRIARDSSYLLLDKRGDEWQLLSFGVMGGANLRSFPDLQTGLDFIRRNSIPKCRCLAIPGSGVVR